MKLLKQSEALITFFHKNNHFLHNKINKKTQHVMLNLYRQIKEAKHFILYQLHPHHISYKQVSMSSQISKPILFKKHNFPEGIHNHIEQHTQSEVTYLFSLCDRKIKVIFILETQNNDVKLCQKYIEPISIWLYMLCHYAPKNCVNSVTIFFYMTSLKKMLPMKKGLVLDERNVNTAFTTSCPANAEIVIFRKEEWFKVFIHETFHTFGLDFSSISSVSVDQCILNIFQVSSHGNSYEAYTEFWAETMNAAFCGFYSTDNETDFVVLFNYFIDMERTYSLFQMVKTLNFMGLTYNDLYSSTKSAASKRESMYKENTNVLAYYVIKTVLLYNYQSFIKWCELHNPMLLEFHKTTTILKQFCEFILKNYKAPLFLKQVKESEEFFTSLVASSRGVHKPLLSNMRMSILELG